MEKQQLLEEIKAAGLRGELSEPEVVSVFRSQSIAVDSSSSKSLNLSTLMYYIGGAIIFLGIAVLLGQNWESFSDAMKIFVTLGSAVITYVVGVLLHKKEGLSGASQSMFLVSLLILPVGVHVVLDRMGLDVAANSSQVLISAFLVAIALASFAAFRRIVFTLFTIVFATWLFHFVIALLFGEALLETSKLVQYELLVVGLAYMFLGYYFTANSQKPLAGVLYGFGSLAFLGAALALGGWIPEQNIFWELVFPLLVFGVIFLSVHLRSRSFLVFGSLFLVGYIFKLTGEYFQDTFGWPLALVLAGLLIMGVGYYAVRINREYIK